MDNCVRLMLFCGKKVKVAGAVLLNCGFLWRSCCYEKLLRTGLLGGDVHCLLFCKIKSSNLCQYTVIS